MTDYAERARDFAKAYVSFVEALVREGVMEDRAREEAHLAALYLLEEHACTNSNPCPMCGR